MKPILRSFVAALLVFLGQTGVAMDKNPISVKRLGTAYAGTQEGEHAGTDVNYTSPIVLRSADGPPAVFYLNSKPAPLVGGIEQHLVKLYPKPEGMFDRIRDALDPFPIDVKGVAFNESGEHRLNTILDEMVTADLFGDGNEQLILVRNGGGVHVYNATKEVFDYQIPTPTLKNFNYKVEAVHTARIGNRDHVFLAINRDPYDAGDTLPKRPPYALLHISHRGIQQIELEGFDAASRRIVGVGTLGVSGDAPPNLLILAQEEKDDSLYFYRYSADGKPMDQAREFYVKVPHPLGLRFAYVPNRSEVIAIAPSESMLLFISPDKSVNWIRDIALEQKFDARWKDLQFLGPYLDGNRVMALVRRQYDVYLLDAEGDTYIWQGDRLVAKAQPTPLLTLPQSSDQHELVDVMLDGDAKKPVLLTMEHRAAQLRTLSDEELADASKRYLDAHIQARCDEELVSEMEFNTVMLDQMDTYCQRHSIACPKVHSTDDIKRLLPDFYAEQLAYAHGFMVNCRRRYLVSEAQFEQTHPSRKRSVGDIVDWFRTNYLDDELTLSAIDIRRHILFSRSVEKYRPARKQYPEIALPQFRHYEQGGTHYLTGSFAEGGSEDEEHSGYYLLTWH